MVVVVVAVATGAAVFVFVFVFVVVVVVQIHIKLHRIIQCIQSRACGTKDDVGNETTSSKLWSGPHLMPKTRNQQKKV